jgi:hypothetical protein
MKDRFGNEVTEAEARMLLRATRPGAKRTDKSPEASGYAAVPGSGPEGEMCKSCDHLSQIRGYAKRFHKCRLMARVWTNGKKTDVLVRSPACAHWTVAIPEEDVRS